MRILITGHTGFKGSWLSMFLSRLGHEVIGVSLPPDGLSLFKVANVERHLQSNKYLDIRKTKELKEFIYNMKPNIIFHLAAQPLVKKSYLEPALTVETNVIGSLNILEISRNLDSLQSLIYITTDKVYKNFEKTDPYSEDDQLGGHDLYSASKAMADLMAQSWNKSFEKSSVLIARAGNVIGGGDFSQDRLVPDIFRSISDKRPLKVRNLGAVRPWQYVLDCLNGYYELMTASLERQLEFDIWNFGPNSNEYKSVEDLLIEVRSILEKKFLWEEDSDSKLHEAKLLTLDSTRAEHNLNWKNKLNFQESIAYTIEWYVEFNKKRDAQKLSMNQIDKFLSI